MTTIAEFALTKKLFDLRKCFGECFFASANKPDRADAWRVDQHSAAWQWKKLAGDRCMTAPGVGFTDFSRVHHLASHQMIH